MGYFPKREPPPDADRCAEIVLIPDVPRYTGRRTNRNRSGFEMHYSKRLCVRRAVTGGYCKQHAKIRGLAI